MATETVVVEQQETELRPVDNTRGDTTSEVVVLQREYLAMLHAITVAPRRGN